MRMSSAEYQKRFGSGVGNQVVGPKKAAIRLSKTDKMSKVEREYGRILEAEFRGLEVRYEEFTFKLPGGNYTPDFTVWDRERLVLAVETKGAYRLGSAGRSHFAFKSAREAWPNIRFRFAQSTKDGWVVSE